MIIGFLNSDDFYYENALEIVSDYFEKRDRFLFGSYKLLYGFNQILLNGVLVFILPIL